MDMVPSTDDSETADAERLAEIAGPPLPPLPLHQQLRRPWVQVETGMLSRVLYPNPVCLLTTQDPMSGARNVMTITWLTPINNQGGFVCSMNCQRHSATFVRHVGAHFVLNVPVAGMEARVLAIGGCSGADVDKFATLDLATCAVGRPTDEACESSPSATTTTTASADDGTSRHKKPKLSKQELRRRAIREAAATCVALRDCIAHVLCRVERLEVDDGHWLLRCSQLAAWCDTAYWDGRNFLPREPALPEILTFLGSKTFGYVARCSQSTGS